MYNERTPCRVKLDTERLGGHCKLKPRGVLRVLAGVAPWTRRKLLDRNSLRLEVESRWSSLWRLLLVTVLCALSSGLHVEARGEPRPWEARVLWARADRVYVVLADSSAVLPGTVLKFLDRGKTVASGEV